MCSRAKKNKVPEEIQVCVRVHCVLRQLLKDFEWRNQTGNVSKRRSERDKNNKTCPNQKKDKKQQLHSDRCTKMFVLRPQETS